MARLGELGKIITGNTPATSNPQNYCSNDICFVKPSDILSDEIRNLYSSEFYIAEFARDNARILPPRSVLVTCIGIIGKVAINAIECAFNQQINAIIPNEEKCIPEYLAYAIQHKQPLLQTIANAPVVPIINKSQFSDIEIRIPCLHEQQEAINNLDSICNTIALRKQQLAKLDELVKARFVEMFGDPVENDMNWQTEVLDSICSTIVDCPHSTPSYTAEDTGYMCIRTSIVKKNRILWDQIEYIPEHEYRQRIQRKKPEKGDIIYTREGAILGIAAIIDRDCNVALGQRSMLLSPDTSKCSPQFLSTAMNFDSFLRKALGGISGSASPHINVGDIKAFSIIMPPIELQAQFAAFVAQTDKSKLAVQQSIDQMETLKKSLMQQYFG